MSHPSWVCGLKQSLGQRDLHRPPSHPSWVCGLKLFFGQISVIILESHPSWVCGLKQCLVANLDRDFPVTPFVGVWIETSQLDGFDYVRWVTPFVGVWIETCHYTELLRSKIVTPFVGVWIETLPSVLVRRWYRGSHPSWVCGLKQKRFGGYGENHCSHTLRGCVD